MRPSSTTRKPRLSRSANIYGNVPMPALGNIGNIMGHRDRWRRHDPSWSRRRTFTCLVSTSSRRRGCVSFLGMWSVTSRRRSGQDVHGSDDRIAWRGRGPQPSSTRSPGVTSWRPREVRASCPTAPEPTEERTGIWAWHHPHKADGTTYTRLRRTGHGGRRDFPTPREASRNDTSVGPSPARRSPRGYRVSADDHEPDQPLLRHADGKILRRHQHQ